jgi:hypothetical protein
MPEGYAQYLISLLTRTLSLTPEVGTAQRGQSTCLPGRVQTDITSKGLRDSEEECSETQRFKFLCHGIGVTATTCRKLGAGTPPA